MLRAWVGRYLYRLKYDWFIGAQAIFINYRMVGQACSFSWDTDGDWASVSAPFPSNSTGNCFIAPGRDATGGGQVAGSGRRTSHSLKTPRASLLV